MSHDDFLVQTRDFTIKTPEQKNQDYFKQLQNAPKKVLRVINHENLSGRRLDFSNMETEKSNLFSC